MQQYNLFVKDILDLTGYAKSLFHVISFEVNRDLLSDATSTFEVLEVPENVNVGDMIGLYDQYGRILYVGIIESVSGNEITAEQPINLFNDNWKWHHPTGIRLTTIEQKIQSIINTDFINSTDTLLSNKFSQFGTPVIESSTTGTFEAQEEPYVTNLKDFLVELYKQYGVIVDFTLPYGNTAPTITLKKATNATNPKISNNVNCIRNLTPVTEVIEKNKLVIYNNEGTTLRGTYYATTGGITTDPASPLRLPVVNTEFIFNTDDAIETIRDEHLQNEILNHKITFDLILDNKLYDYFSWELGMNMQVWYNGKYFKTVYTGYSISKSIDVDVANVLITCGTVRNKLTEIFNARR